MEGGEDISDEPISHVKYKWIVFPYMPDGFGPSNPRCTQQRGLTQTRVSIIIIYIQRQNYLSIYVMLFSVRH